MFTAIGELRRKMFEQSGKLFKGVPIVFRNSQTVKSATSTTGHVIKTDVPVTRGLVALHLPGFFSGPTSQFLNGTHEFSELVLAGMAWLFIDQGLSVLLLSAGIWRVVAGTMFRCALNLSI